MNFGLKWKKNERIRKEERKYSEFVELKETKNLEGKKKERKYCKSKFERRENLCKLKRNANNLHL